MVYQSRIIGRGYNQTETLQDPTAHAEMIAISAAANALHSWRLENCSLFVTLEPCAMCGGAIVLSRIKRLVFSTCDPKAGACGSLRNIVEDQRLNHQVEVTSGCMEEESRELLKLFFQNLRTRERKE